jgi:hypothetical protein
LGEITSTYKGIVLISPKDLEDALRASCESLKNVQVGYTSNERAQLAPTVVTVGGVITIHGIVKAYEADIDLRSIKDVKDLELLIKELLKSFAMAERSDKLH